MESAVGVRNSVCVLISRLEFQQLAIKYGVWNAHKTCNIQISRSNYSNAKVTRCGENIVKTITLNLSRSDFLYCSQQNESSERYGFRARKRALENAVCPQPKRNRAIVGTNTKVPKLVVASKNTLTEGVVVIAKMRTYAAWPARIMSFRKTCANVEFFGEGTTGNVRYIDIGLFQDNNLLIAFNLQKKINGYHKSVQCAEGALKIPKHLSLLNNI